MIVHDSWWSNKNVFQLSSTIIDYDALFEQGFSTILAAQSLQMTERQQPWKVIFQCLTT